MADDSSVNVPVQRRKAASKEAPSRGKPATSWVIPAITALVLASAFCIYYFVYVAAQREYLANRNFRSLAVLGDQIQTLVSVHGSILEFSADLAEPERKTTTHRNKQNLSQFLVVRSEDKKMDAEERNKETQKDYLKYLAPNFELMERPVAAPEKPAKAESRLEVQRRNGRWELVLTAQRHPGAKKDYSGSLGLDDMLKPLVASLPFDDILLVSEKGIICYQSNRAGPQFTTLTALLQAQPDAGETKPASSGGEAHGESGAGSADRVTSAASTSVNQNADQTWRSKSKHLTDVTLAGTRYKLFLQPVLVDVFSDEPDANEPAREWVLCGLRSSKALQWEALSISSTSIIAFTALFLAVCMSGPLLKVLFMNQRERLRLRELGVLGIFLILLTSVFTLSGLEAVGVPLNDDTEKQLKDLGDKMSANIHAELQDMRDQLMNWCKTKELNDDLALAKDKEIIRNTPDRDEEKDVDKPTTTATANLPAITPVAEKYPYLNNAFWTDDDGHQVVKWSTSGYLTPMIDVSPLRIYSHPKSTYLNGKVPPFHFDSLVPPNKFEYLAALTISTRDCLSGKVPPDIRGDISGGSAFLTAQPFSLIDPILPLGYGFALLDETGSVLFHSDKTRNLHENFLQESDWSRQLYAASFGHSTERSLPVKYLGKDYEARVIPVKGVSQAPWSLIVYRDLSSVRTLNLQAMTMTTTLLLGILALPVVIVAIWCAIRQPRFAPEWLWPHAGRMGAYVRQSAVYSLLIILFLFLGFAGSSEQNMIACVVVPYAALLLTVWCLRANQPTANKSGRGWSWLQSGTAMLSLLGTIVFLAAASWLGAHSQLFKYLFGMAVIAALPLLQQPRHFLAMTWKRSFHAGEGPGHSAMPAESASYAWRKYYVLSLILLLLLVGVLTPMALFRVTLNVERRLATKKAQLHLASALGQRLISVRERCDKGELGQPTCDEFKNEKSTIWPRIVLDPMFPSDGMLLVRTHSAPEVRELYTGWLQKLVYALHYDYNKEAAEMSGVILDRFTPKPGSDFPDWAWENDGPDPTLRWHGIHLLKPGSSDVEDDLLIEAHGPTSSMAHGFAAAAVAAGVILAIGLILWMLVRKIFLFNVVPLKMTGARQAIESIREGRNVAILVPPVSNWHLDAQKWTMDLKEVATGPKWAEALDLETLPLNTVIEIVHFEYSSNDAEIDNQKFLLLDRLLQREYTQVVVEMTVPVSAVDHRRMFPVFEVVDLREEPFFWLNQYDGSWRDLIWKECGPVPALWPIGAQLAKDIKPEDSHTEETIASEILERADPYYRLVWKECSSDQKFVLAQLAEDGLLNPTNSRAIRQMVRRGLITADPQFRIVNESFRRFLQSHTSADLKRKWLDDAKLSGWGKAHGAFFTTMLLLGGFLLTTQNELWQSSAAYVTTALGALGTLSKLWNTYRGGVTGATEKAG